MAPAELRRRALPQRQPPARDDRLRPARRSGGPGLDRLAGSVDHGGGVRRLLPMGDGGARVPVRHQRHRTVRLGGDQGAPRAGRDPAIADYPTDTKVSSTWFKLGFPSGYMADVLQNLEVLTELGKAKDRRLDRALELVLAKQDAQGRWRNEYPYRGKLWSDVERPRERSKWVTLRACAVVKAALG